VLLYGVLDSTIKIGEQSLMLMIFFYGNILLDFNVLFGYEKASIAMILILCFFMIEIDVTRALKHARNMQNMFCFLIILFYIIMQFSEAMQTEADYMIDNFLLLIVALVYHFRNGSWLEKSGKLKASSQFEDKDSDVAAPRIRNSMNNIKNLSCVKTIRKVIPYALIIMSVKLSYFFDREKSLNFPLHPTLEGLRNFIQSNQGIQNA